MKVVEDVRGEQRARELRKSRFAMSVLAALGFALLVVGVLLEPDPGHRWLETFSRVIVGVGGVLFGTSLSLLVNDIYAPQALDELRTILGELNSAPWRTSNEEHLSVYRRKFHGYLHSKHDGQWVWIYRVFDFRTSGTPGMLHATVEYPGTDGPSKYVYYGFIMRRRLVLVGLNAKDAHEPAVIQVFPDHSSDNLHAGLAFVLTPRNENILSPSLLSGKLLTAAEVGLGAIKDTKEYPALTKAWADAFQAYTVAKPVAESGKAP